MNAAFKRHRRFMRFHRLHVSDCKEQQQQTKKNKCVCVQQKSSSPSSLSPSPHSTPTPFPSNNQSHHEDEAKPTIFVAGLCLIFCRDVLVSWCFANSVLRTQYVIGDHLSLSFENPHFCWALMDVVRSD